MDSFPAKTPVFAGQNYGVWAVKMEAYLKAFDLWEIVDKDKQPTSLGNNPTVAQIKFHNEEKAKLFKALACLHGAVSEEIFTRIMACKTAKEAWDKLKAEFYGHDKSRKMQVLNLRRQFEGLRMKESETVAEFSSQVSKIVNQIRLLGEDFADARIIEKILVSLPERFEHKICSLEDSKDLSEFSLQELVNALQAVEQRQAFRKEGTSEGAFVAVSKDKSQSKDSYNRGKGKYGQSNNRQQNFNKEQARKKSFPPCKFCRKTNHLDTHCWFKDVQCRNCKQFGHYQKYCKEKGVAEQQARVADNSEAKEEFLFMAAVEGVCNTARVSNSSWLIDSGCTNHMTADLSLFSELDRSYVSRVRIGNGDHVKVGGKGTAELETLSGTKYLKNVLYVPEINQNLVSVGQLIESGYSLNFHNGVCDIKDKNGLLLLTIQMLDRSFNVDWKEACLCANVAIENESVLWHKRLGHSNYVTLKKMSDLKMVSGLPNIQGQNEICEACSLGKQTRSVFPDSTFRATEKI